MSNEYVFEQLTLVEIAAPIWGGERALPKKELQLRLKDYTDKGLDEFPAVKPGKIQLIDNDKLAPFIRYRTQAKAALLKRGVRYMSAVGIPNALARESIDDIKRSQEEFNSYKRMFLYNYDDWVDQFAKANPEISQFISDHKIDVSVIEKSFDFEYNVFRIAAFDDSEEAREQLDKTTEGLGDAMFGDIAAIATKTLSDVVRDKREYFSPKIHSTFEGMLKKMRGLAFLDGSILPLCDTVEASLATIPKEGRITDNAFVTAIGVLKTLSDPLLMKMVGEGKEQIQGRSQPGLLAMLDKRQATNVAQPVKPEPVSPSNMPADDKQTDMPTVETPPSKPAKPAPPIEYGVSPMAGFKL